MEDLMHDSFAAAEVRVRDFVCSQCWGSLRIGQGSSSKGFMVVCIDCEYETTGYTTKYHAKHTENMQLEEAAEILSMHPHMRPEGDSKRADNVLKELGF